ncbi:hypothetical protein KR059_011224, partial [Drosophila kikkawai]
LWDKVETEYEACSERISVGFEGAADTLPTLKAKYDDTYSIYERCAAKFMEQIDTISAKAAPVQPPAPQNSFPSGCRLPPCETEVFSGDYLRWPTFRDLFTAVYIDNPTLTPVEKLFYLNAKTSGEAHSIVSNSPLTNDGFRSAWKNLSERFENKRALVNSQLKKLLNIQSIERESSAALKELQNTIQNCLTSLALSGLPTDNWDCLLVYLCSTKLPKLTLSLWEQSLTNKTDIPSWLELDSFLTERHRTLETIDSLQPPTICLPIDDIRPSSSGQFPARPTAASAPVRRLNFYEARVAPAPRGCDLCSRENHPIRLCPRFLEMDVDGRSDYIRRKQFCLNCFARLHQQRDCTSAHSCLTCRSRHHTLLHRDNPSATAPSPTAPPRLRPAPNPQGTGASQDHTDVQVGFASGSRAVLLGTALITIYHLGRDFQARALIDSGSEATFITERLFRQISPPFTPVQTRVSGLNETVAAQSTKLCTLAIRAPSRPGLQLETAAYVLPQLAGKLPSYPIPRDLLKELPDVPLADPTFFESSEIDVLIGADILPSVLLGGSKNNIFGS